MHNLTSFVLEGLGIFLVLAIFMICVAHAKLAKHERERQQSSRTHHLHWPHLHHAVAAQPAVDRPQPGMAHSPATGEPYKNTTMNRTMTRFV